MSMHITRRQALKTAALSALSTWLPGTLRGAEGVLTRIRTDRTLVLLELEGGNDGINTLVPYLDATYQLKRSATKLQVDSTDWRKQVIPLSTFSGTATLVGDQTGLGIHAALDPLRDAWQAGDLAVVQGVGYDQPNLSHFRGGDIWHSGADDSQPPVQDGWLGRAMALQTVDPSQATTAAMLFRRDGGNPAKSAAISTISMYTPSEFLERSTASQMPLPSDALFAAAAGKPAVLHLLNTQKAVNEAHDAVNDALGTPPTFTTTFPTTDLGYQVQYVAQAIAGGLPCPFYKISIAGFDTHANQVNTHAQLLAQVGNALKALRAALIEKGLWDQVLIMTYSEFGRRIEENSSAGTDHGTAAPHLLLGGKVLGGLYGTQPALDDPDVRGNLIATTDFRRLYATCGTWLGVSSSNLATALDPADTGRTYEAIDCLDLA